MIKQPHADKVLMEKLLHKTYNIQSADFNKVIAEDSPKSNVFDSGKLFILRPSLLNDGQAKRIVRSSNDVLSSAWFISRKDVGAYIVGNCLLIGDKVIEQSQKNKSESWSNGLVISY